ncbi:hypothetical protein U6A24_11430 [Aquimarina gracilis]|uniref:Uncharacterized protein n=1 Tax=Aquimarina gracilis TaxID=874422 RepID=A0ABU5ZW19_9FLAO|nr:hypothetical protein [Aquimarina gracilis]MEB3346076.1 hypothetical protein [Aquimarina gracilis]
MTKLLHSSFLLVFFLITHLGNAQLESEHVYHAEHHDLEFLSDAENLNFETLGEANEKDFSYISDINKEELQYLYLDYDNDHDEELALIDIISSDEGTDFNCSGGFCMNKHHYHKKGLTLKRQFFIYFMSITC